MNVERLHTIGEVAKYLNVPSNRVDYAIRVYGIKETQRAGILRLYDADAVQRVERAVRRIDMRNRSS